MRRKSLVFGLVAGFLQACGGDDPVHFESPPRHAFIADGAPVAVRIEADRHERVELSVDGGDPVLLEAQGGGRFLGEVALPAGRHRLVATLPDVPGAAEGRDVFVGRAPDAPIDGFGFAPEAAYALTLSNASPADDGLYEGRLSVFSLEEFGEPFHRVLSKDGVLASMSAAGTVAWMDSWSNGRGTLHFGPIDGEETARVKDARSHSFAPGGETVGVLDDGVIVFTTGSSHRITESARAFVFSGPGGDLAAFEGESGTSERTAIFASAPDYEPTFLATTIFPIIASSPTRREAALVEFREPDEPRGPLVLYDYVTRTVARPFDEVGGFTFSRDGDWLLALVNVVDDSASIGLLRRDADYQVTLDGAFTRAGFDDASERLFAVESGGLSRLFVVHLDEVPPVPVSLAIGVSTFFALPEGRLLLLMETGDLALVLADDTVVNLGAWNPDLKQISLSPDGTLLAFTAIDGTRRPIRRVDLVNMHIGDLGDDASKPLALGDGAVAWAERNGDALDLWMLPTFPLSILGPRRMKAAVDPFRAFAPSPSGEDFALVAGDRVWCFDSGAHEKDLGPADADRHEAFFLPDGRLVRFGLDGSEKRVLFIQRCE